MKSLHNYITESIDFDNLFWKIDMWFFNKDEEYKVFKDIVKTYKFGIQQQDFVNQLLNTKLLIKPFIDFLHDNINMTESDTIDYIYQFKKVIEYIKQNNNNDIIK